MDANEPSWLEWLQGNIGVVMYCIILVLVLWRPVEAVFRSVACRRTSSATSTTSDDGVLSTESESERAERIVAERAEAARAMEERVRIANEERRAAEAAEVLRAAEAARAAMAAEERATGGRSLVEDQARYRAEHRDVEQVRRRRSALAESAMRDPPAAARPARAEAPSVVLAEQDARYARAQAVDAQRLAIQSRREERWRAATERSGRAVDPSTPGAATVRLVVRLAGGFGGRLERTFAADTHLQEVLDWLVLNLERPPSDSASSLESMGPDREVPHHPNGLEGCELVVPHPRHVLCSWLDFDISTTAGESALQTGVRASQAQLARTRRTLAECQLPRSCVLLLVTTTTTV